MNLTNIHRVKQLIVYEGIVDDKIFTQIINAVSKAIEKSPLFDRYIEKKERTEQFDTEYDQRIFVVKGVPIDTDQTFKIWHDTAREWGSGTEIDTDNYYVEAETGRIKMDRYTVSAGDGSLKIQYTGGLSLSADRLLGTIETKVGTYVVGETITGNLSGAKGLLVSQTDSAIAITMVSGEFEIGETLTGGTSSATSKLKTVTQIPLVVTYPDLAYACELQSAFQFQRKNEIGLRNVSIEGGSIATYDPIDFLPEVKRILSGYKRIGLVG